ncbi:hypothetical protein ABBQ32_013479 [Trebouxia sp. C0010 RCD-2024]
MSTLWHTGLHNPAWPARQLNLSFRTQPHTAVAYNLHVMVALMVHAIDSQPVGGFTIWQDSTVMSRETTSMAAKTDETERSTEQLVTIQCKRMPYNPNTLYGQRPEEKKQKSMHREVEGLPCGRCSIPGMPWGNQVQY